ncbi:MAG: hypothetical protein K9M45_07065 [Kiritimatiellales bacterium]|nr:hypothetical protein [Kiritimatiellales bacterium]
MKKQNYQRNADFIQRNPLNIQFPRQSLPALLKKQPQRPIHQENDACPE